MVCDASIETLVVLGSSRSLRIFRGPVALGPVQNRFGRFSVGSGEICLLPNRSRNRLAWSGTATGVESKLQIFRSGSDSLTTLEPDLQTLVWLKTLRQDVDAYCRSCTVCSTIKAKNHQPYGKLQPLPVPSRPWETIGVNFVGPLPESRNRVGSFDMITVIIDHSGLTCMVHLAPSRQTYKAKEIAELMFEEVYRHHGLPENIVSD